jgi:predicted phage tail component-like protein
MYEFKDITQVVEASESVLPSEALMINGEYIENLIPGYRTLNVAGRESLSPEIETFSTGSRDGSTLKSKRYPERIITITYQLIAQSNEAFREAFNTLGKVLNVEDAELIFNDEQDKYFIGTPCTIEEVEPGRNAVVGKFEILCADPFKYSVYEYEAEADLVENSILVDYKGTYKAFPILQADFFKENEISEDGETVQGLTGAGDCGYVGFFNEDEKIIQVGDVDEVDGEENAFSPSQTLILDYFDYEGSWGTAAKKLWTLNNGVVFPDTVVQSGNVANAEAPQRIIKINSKHKTTTILNKAKSTSSEPTFYYTVTVKTSARAENKIKLSFAVTAALGRSSSYFGNGYTLKGSLYVAGQWHDFTFKNSSTRWEGTSGHTVNISVTVDNLTASTSSITGIKFKAFRGDSLGTAGTLASTSCSSVPIPYYEYTREHTCYLAASSYGEKTRPNIFHGASISRDIPADASGAVGAANFSFSYTHQMCVKEGAQKYGQRGAFQVVLSDKDRNQVARIRIEKKSIGKTADLIFSAKNFTKTYTNAVDMVYKTDYLSPNNKDNVKSCSIEKSGDSITFKAVGKTFTWRNEALIDVAVTKITFSFEALASCEALGYNGIGQIEFRKNYCDTFKDIPNKFGSGDCVEVDCASGEIFLNGVPKPELGALGNDWETFYLKPGLNQIGVAYSDWIEADYAPTFKVRYREVFL